MAGQKRRVLIVGAGFAGAVYARVLAEAGVAVDIIDKRDHIAGNCFDIVHETGVRYHRYGPHLFHTSIPHVIEWVTRFAIFVPYAHRVSVLLDNGRHVPLPINIDTLNSVFSKTIETEEHAEAFVASLARSDGSEANAAEYLVGRLGEKLTDIFFRPYTKKMWGLDLEQLDASVVKRIPIRFSRESRYFPDDTFQALPKNGYAALFESILDHEHIRVRVATAFDDRMRDDFGHVFNSMPVDEYFGFRFGHLPYRSIKFHHETVSETRDSGPTPVVNYSDTSAFTRRTDWSKLPGHRIFPGAHKLLTTEEPCDYRDNDFERYYPIRSTSGDADKILVKYRVLADQDDGMDFIGRCGTYRYLDMHQVINQSLQGARKWLDARALAA